MGATHRLTHAVKARVGAHASARAVAGHPPAPLHLAAAIALAATLALALAIGAFAVVSLVTPRSETARVGVVAGRLRSRHAGRGERRGALARADGDAGRASRADHRGMPARCVVLCACAVRCARSGLAAVDAPARAGRAPAVAGAEAAGAARGPRARRAGARHGHWAPPRSRPRGASASRPSCRRRRAIPS